MRTHAWGILSTATVIGAVLVLSAGVALAVPAVLPVTFDEFGNGTRFDGSPMTGVMALDPGPGNLSPTLTLTYRITSLPIGLVVGDVLLLEPPQGGLSDMVRFNADGYMVFYSDLDDGAVAPADVGLPTTLYLNNVSIGEEDGFTVYTPAPGQPGYTSAIPGLTYHIISDSAVPEPATLLLVGSGAMGLLGVLRRRRMN